MRQKAQEQKPAVVITLGAGDIDRLVEPIAEALQDERPLCCPTALLKDRSLCFAERLSYLGYTKLMNNLPPLWGGLGWVL